MFGKISRTLGVPQEGGWSPEEYEAIVGQVTRVPKTRVKIIG